MAKKRTHDEISDSDTITTIGQRLKLSKDWFDVLLDTDNDILVAFVAELSDRSKIPMDQIERARSKPLSCGDATWDDLTQRIPTLPENPEHVSGQFNLPLAIRHLSSTFHIDLFSSSRKNLTVYGRSTINEESRVRIFEAYMVPIISLFHGRIIDKPEQPMLSTDVSSGGAVEHKLWIFDGVLLLVVELKRLLALQTNIAQLFVKMYSAVLSNAKLPHKHVKVYGILTDLSDFHFYEYDPAVNSFARTVRRMITVPALPIFGQSMVQISNIIFSIMFQAYIDVLASCQKLSNQRSKDGDHGPPDSSPHSYRILSGRVPNPPGTAPLALAPISDAALGQSSRNLSSKWDEAVLWAQQADEKFKVSYSTIEELDQNAVEAVRLLRKSVLATPFEMNVSPEEEWLYGLDGVDLRKEVTEIVTQVLLKGRHESKGSA